MKRFGQLIGFKEDNLAKYKKFHDEIWPEISGAIKKAGIQNYSIFHHQGKLFGYYEYTGPPEEFEARMKALAEAPRMREWWDIMEPMQIPDPSRPDGSWWTDMEEVFHLD